MIEKNLLNNLVSVTMFNQGQASKIFNRLHDEKQIVVLKNNVPTAVLLSPDEYFVSEVDSLPDCRGGVA